jgi:hypothetical protein
MSRSQAGPITIATDGCGHLPIATVISVAMGVVMSLEPIATMIHQKLVAKAKHICNHYSSKVSTKS